MKDQKILICNIFFSFVTISKQAGKHPAALKYFYIFNHRYKYLRFPCRTISYFAIQMYTNKFSQDRKFRMVINVNCCPGFSWDRDNFHKKLVGLTETDNQMGYSIPCDVMLSI